MEKLKKKKIKNWVFLNLDMIDKPELSPRHRSPAVLIVDVAQALEQPHHHNGDEQLAECEESGDGLPLGAQAVKQE